MKINSISRQPNFRGKIADGAVNFIAKHPLSVAAVAGASAIAQKVIMAGSEATIAPAMDIAIGKVITDVTKEKDDRTMQSSKVQAVRTSAQAIGGTITGVVIRFACIVGCTALFMKAGEKAGGAIAKVVNPIEEKIDSKTDFYKYSEKMSAWGKSAGGALALAVMMITNFVLDPPIINAINKKFSDLFIKDTPKVDKKEEVAHAESK